MHRQTFIAVTVTPCLSTLQGSGTAGGPGIDFEFYEPFMNRTGRVGR